MRSEHRASAGIPIPHEARYTALNIGGVRVEESVFVPDVLSDLARVGTVLEAVAGLESVAAHYVPYIRPQENGGHADVRWLRLFDGTGRSIRLSRDLPGQVSATHFRAADLAAATHDVELEPRPETIVHLDAAHRGLGTANCGPDTLPHYLVGEGSCHWSWTLTERGAPD